MSTSTPEEIKAEYASSLADLKFNSKPLINVLTMLAEENAPNAGVIVEAIETHLAKVSTEVKLPILYLIDCIVKNVAGTYTSLFSQNIVTTFCSVFKAVDEKTRAEMFKLRQTWNDVFPQMKLYAIDVQISLLDPAWPVTAKPPPNNSIHFNPKFLKNSAAPTLSPKMEPTAGMPAAVIPGAAIDKETLLMQEKLIQKQKELLELQQKKLELEVLQTKVKLQEQMKNNVPVRPQNILLKPEVAKQLVPNLKHKPAGIGATSIQQRNQANSTNGSRVTVSNAPVTATSSKPIRDPRLLRQQQQKQPDSNSNVQLGQKSANLENKNVSSKTGVRKFRNDPRLIVNKDNVPTPKNDTPKPSPIPKSQNSTILQKSQKTSRTGPKSNSDTSSLKSSSSLGSPNKNSKSDKLHSSTSASTVKHKKKEKNIISNDSSTISSKKISQKEKRDRSEKSENNSPSNNFKDVKISTKNRNYVRRNLPSVSPEPTQDEDLRPFGPPEKQPRLQSEAVEQSKTVVPSPPVVSTTKEMDVDLRQLPAPILGKKRPSLDAPEENPKKKKAEVFDRLFGDEDTDLRQLNMGKDRPSPVRQRLSPMGTSPHSPKPIDNPTSSTESKSPDVTIIDDRPPTPPPPIISSTRDSPSRSDVHRRNFDVSRAKLANATSRNKNKSSSRKNKSFSDDLDLRHPRVTSTTPEVPQPIVISPEDATSIETGNMSKERSAQLLQKIIVQMEREKLKEAKKKEHEESLNISLTPISDDEFEDDDNDPQCDKIEQPTEVVRRLDNFHSLNENSLPFNDKDERLAAKHMHPTGEYVPPPPTFYPRDRFPGPPTWRGARGSRRHWDNQNHPRGGARPWRGHANNWRHATLPYPPRDFGPGPMQDEGPPHGVGDVPEQLTNGAVNQDEIKSITIDGSPKDIRFYDETGVIFINWDDPREISFMNDGSTRRVTFNDKDSYILGFNEPYSDLMIDGVLHKVKLGVPSREIYIDFVPYECFFGSAGIRIDLNGKSVHVKLDGPPPQAKIGDVKRTDLVAGKINLFINAKIIVPVYLDGKLQKFMLDGEMNTLKFVNSLQTVLINDIPFDVEYGDLPKPILINGKKHFIRFSVLPKGIKPGRIRIKDMEGPQPTSPYQIEENSQDSQSVDRVESLNPGAVDRIKDAPNLLHNILEQQNLSNLDVFSNVITPPAATTLAIDGYKVDNQQTVQQNVTNPSLPTIPPALNINDLFQKLVASGFVTTTTTAASVPLRPLPVQEIPKKDDENLLTPDSTLKPQQTEASPPKTRRSICDYLKPILFEKPETLKVRQSSLYGGLYSGMQCSSCGMRFSPEASMQYSQHLDWHFRQNRKGKRNIRVAASRRWYYSVADWKNYEELEDLEEREKNYFDQQQQAEGGGDDAEEEIEIPSVPADPDSTDECCEVCRDKFDQFFNEEKEEWHLRNALRVEEKTYHPVCFEDYQKSLTEQVDESVLDQSVIEEPKPEEPTIPGLEIIIDDDDEEPLSPALSDVPEVVSLESDESKTVGADQEESQEAPPEEEEDDDDVILNEVAPIKIVVDDDDEEYNPEEPIENLVKIKKEKVDKMDDGFVEVSGLVSLQNGGQIKIKAEPVDPDEVAMVPIDVHDTTTESEEVLEIEGPPSPGVIAVHSELVPSIDGNIELVSSVPSITSSGISGNKIKINISKPLPVINTNKDKESSVEGQFPSETYIDPSEPFPPGEEPEPVTLKPALKGVNLKKLPAVKRGSELTGLCCIM